MDRRKNLLWLAVAVAIIGTASLYLLSASLEHEDTGSGEASLSVKTLLDKPSDYLNREVQVEGNISGVKNYTNSTVFYLKDGNYSLTCISYENITVKEGSALLTGKLVYNEKWGNYEFVIKKVEYG